MRTLLLAARNLRRNLRRTLLTLAAISFGLASMIFTVCIQEGSYDDMIRSAISQLAGHVVVQAPGYQDEREEALVVPEAGAVDAALKGMFPDAVVARRITIGGLLVSPTSSVGAGVLGVEPLEEAAVIETDEKVIDGRWLSGTDERDLVIGVTMAEVLGVGVGDKLVYMGQPGTAEMVSRLFRVSGIFRTGSDEMDGFLAYADLAAAQAIMDRPDAAHLVTVHLPNADTSAAATEVAAQGLATRGLDVRSWIGALPELYGLIQVDRSSGDVMLSVVGLIVAMGVLNTVLMSTLERTREFGVMMALGMRPRRLAVLVLSEGLLLGTLGCAGGLALGALFAWPLITYGIDTSSYVGGEAMDMGGVAVDAVIRGAWSWSRISKYAIASILFTVAAAAYPAWRVTRLQPVAAMRHH